MAITQDDFKKVWASTSSVPQYTFSDTDYKNGWEFVGNLPPTRAMWDYLQKNNDEKMQYLANNYLPLTGGTVTGVVNGVTPPNGDNSKKLATTAFVQAAIATGYYNSVDEMRKSETAIVGRPCVTLGYYAPNDGGGAVYIIRSKKESDVDDGGSILVLDNGNVAELMFDGAVNVKQFGAVGDGTHDDTVAFSTFLNYCRNKNILGVVDGIFLLTDTVSAMFCDIEFTNNSCLYFNNSTGDGFVFRDCRIRNFKARAIDGFTGALFHCNDTLAGDEKTYPSRTVVDGCFLNSNTSAYVCTLFKHTAAGYGNTFSNFRFGRFLDGSQFSDSRHCLQAVKVVVPSGKWATGMIYENIIVDVKAIGNVVEFDNSTNNVSLCMHFVIKGLQIQTDSNMGGNKHLCMFKTNYCQGFLISDSYIWDFSHDYADNLVVYEHSQNFRISANSTSFGIYADNGKYSYLNTTSGNALRLFASDEKVLGVPTYCDEHLPTPSDASDNSFVAYPILFKRSNKANNLERTVIHISSVLDYESHTSPSELIIEGYGAVYKNCLYIRHYNNSAQPPFVKKIKLYNEGIVVWIKQKKGYNNQYQINYKAFGSYEFVNGTKELTVLGTSTTETPVAEAWDNSSVIAQTTGVYTSVTTIDSTTNLHPEIESWTGKAPKYVGQICVSGGDAYIATGLTTSDWKRINNA